VVRFAEGARTHFEVEVKMKVAAGAGSKVNNNHLKNCSTLSRWL